MQFSKEPYISAAKISISPQTAKDSGLKFWITSKTCVEEENRETVGTKMPQGLIQL